MVLMASAEGIGKSNTEAIMEAMGGKGEFAIVSCGETADQLNQWIAEIKKFTEANYPEATVVDTVFAGEDVAKATQMATDLMNAHPKLTGIVGTMQAAEALKLAAGIGESLSGRLLLLDALSMEWRTVRFKKDAGCAVCGPTPAGQLPGYLPRSGADHESADGACRLA